MIPLYEPNGKIFVMTKIRPRVCTRQIIFRNPVFGNVSNKMPTFHRQLETRGTQVHRCVKTFLFLFLRKSQETKTLFTKTGRKHSLYVSALASRKGGWSGIRLAFRRELAWGVSCFAMDTVHVEENLFLEPSQARPDVELEHCFQTQLARSS